MKRLFLIFGLLLAFGAVNAQSANTERAHSQALKMKKMLTLSDDQTVKVEALLITKLDAIDAINNNTATSGEQKTKEIEAVRTEKEQELATILTPDQYALMLQKKEAARTRESTH